MKTKDYFFEYFWIPAGLLWIWMGTDLQTHFWYDDFWYMIGQIEVIVGLFMFIGCILIHVLIFSLNLLDEHIHNVVDEELNKQKNEELLK